MVAEENNNLVEQADNNNTELNANAEFKGNKDDEEDVLLTAQRYLNIFHQIHIFKEFRQKQFQQQLLEIPQEIRKVIALLPGGRVLLEHIAELMEQNGKRDPTLDALLLNLSQNDHFTDNKVSAKPSAPVLTAPVGAPAIAAPIELGKDFTNALTDSFKAYSQNLKDLSANIQKMALNAPTGIAGQGAPSNDYTKALTASFQAYSQDLKDLTSSIKQIAQNHQSSSAAPASVEFGGEVAKSLTASFDTYARNLEDLTESVKKIAANQQAPMANAPTSIDFGGDVAKSLTSSFDTYARNLEDLTESVKKIAANQQQAPVISASPASIELGGDFSKALTASFEAYSHNLENLTESIKQIAVNNIGQQASSASGDTVLPNFTDSISAVLKENAQQQMDVLKSFGEMLSKTIAESQRELVSSIKSSNRSSMILGKFMEVPVDKTDGEQNNVIAYSKDKDFQVIEQEPAVSILSASSSENVGNIRTADDKKTVEKPVVATPKSQKQQESKAKPEPKKEQKPEVKQETRKEQNPEPQKEHKKEEKVDSKNEVKTEPIKKSDREIGKKPENLPKEKDKNKDKATKTENITPKKPKEDIVDLNLVNLNTVSEPESLNNDFDLNENENEIDINDAFAQVAASLQSQTTDNTSNDLTQAFDIDFSDSPKAKDNVAASTSKQDAKDFDPMAQIRNALHTDNQISLTDFDDDISPISLSPEDDLHNAFSADDTFTAQDNQDNTPPDNTASAFADNTWEYIGGSDAPNETSDDDWEYEYVDENGNPINETDDQTEYEYVDENGNPINPSDDVEYEYVDENGNPINPSDNVEYEYVDENGNPIDPSDDEEWEYEYVDENGNPIDNG